VTRLWIPAALAAAAALAALLFGLGPALDLKSAALFYDGGGHFVADTTLGAGLRRILYWIPTAIVLLLLLLYAGRRFGMWSGWAATGRGVLFCVATFAIGPGLLANTLLKDHSHRPRPYQTDVFGGDEAFRPFYTFDGACRRNCSFVSGEGATSAWTLGPALLVPPPWQGVAIAASLALALCSATLRMAFGGHYLSDSVFAVLVSWTVLWAGWLVFRPDSQRSSADRDPRQPGSRS
jgi:lipid A 4'-phosphatase